MTGQALAKGMLKPGEEIEIHMRVINSKWYSYNKKNDYSLGNEYKYIDNYKIEVYLNNNKKFGIKPKV